MAKQGPQNGRVIAYADKVHLTNCTFKVSQAGRSRVLREKSKNVHAGIVGEYNEHSLVDPLTIGSSATSVRYNPYLFKSFVLADDLSPIHFAKEVYLEKRMMLAIQ